MNARCDAGLPAPRPAAQRVAAQPGSTRLARSSRLDGRVMRRRSAVVAANGGLATTLKGRRGRRRSVASARTTVTGCAAKRSRSTVNRCGCSSTATTDAPACSNCAVIAPVPAPMSTTRSPGCTPAASTSRAIQRLSSWCHPQRPESPATEHHHRRRHGVHSRVGDRDAPTIFGTGEFRYRSSTGFPAALREILVYRAGRLSHGPDVPLREPAPGARVAEHRIGGAVQVRSTLRCKPFAITVAMVVVAGVGIGANTAGAATPPTPTLTVTPDTGLADTQTVPVTGHNLGASTSVLSVECTTERSTSAPVTSRLWPVRSPTLPVSSRSNDRCGGSSLRARQPSTVPVPPCARSAWSATRARSPRRQPPRPTRASRPCCRRRKSRSRPSCVTISSCRSRAPGSVPTRRWISRSASRAGACILMATTQAVGTGLIFSTVSNGLAVDSPHPSARAAANIPSNLNQQTLRAAARSTTPGGATTPLMFDG